MPLVVIQHKTGRVLEDMLTRLTREMPEIVAEALHVAENKEAHLVSSDVEVWVQESGEYDVNVKDLEIIVWANEYPERLRNLDERKDAIIRAVRKFLGDYDRNLSGFVWVLLQPGAYGAL